MLLSVFPFLTVDSSAAEEWSRVMPLIVHLASFSGSQLIAVDISLFKQRNEDMCVSLSTAVLVPNFCVGRQSYSSWRDLEFS
jgi:hypothetical protein